MELITAVEEAGGIMRVGALRAATGASRYALDAAIAAGGLFRAARGWVATAEADPMLLAAARTGVIVSCATQAARLGLWDVRPGEPHVAAHPGRALRRPTSARVHWARPIIPRHPDALEDSIENVLALVAECQPFESALAVWESALNRGTTDLAHLETLRFGAAGERLKKEAQPYSDSGCETVLVPRLRWLGLPLRRQSWILGHRVDLLVGDRLIVQVDGGHHVDLQRLDDNDHDARLRLAGYHVIRVGYWQLVNAWPAVQELIAGAVARGLHRA